MKSFAVPFLFLLFTSCLLAQSPIPHGTFNLAGSLSFSSTSWEGSDNNDSQLLLSPQVGYFFLDNISLSLLVQYSNNSQGEYSQTQWALGPSFRYYMPLDKVYPFLELSYLYNSSTYNNMDGKWEGSKFIITGGIDYFITESVTIESSISYSFENLKLPEHLSPYYSDLDISSNTFRIGLGLNIFI